MSEDTLYLRNRRPNRVRFPYEGVANRLERRGARGDSVALPIEAKQDPLVSRWLRQGILEEISRDAFNKLNARRVDVNPNDFLKRPMRNYQGDKGVPMVAADSDTTHTLTQLDQGEVHRTATPKVEWAGDLMSTEEELEEFLPDIEQQQNYPSRHRDNSEREAMGY